MALFSYKTDAMGIIYDAGSSLRNITNTESADLAFGKFIYARDMSSNIKKKVFDLITETGDDAVSIKKALTTSVKAIVTSKPNSVTINSSDVAQLESLKKLVSDKTALIVFVSQLCQDLDCEQIEIASTFTRIKAKLEEKTENNRIKLTEKEKLAWKPKCRFCARGNCDFRNENFEHTLPRPEVLSVASAIPVSAPVSHTQLNSSAAAFTPASFRQ